MVDQPGIPDGVYYGIAVDLRRKFPCAGSVLDVGCGTGQLLQHLVELFPRAGGCEPDEDCFFKALDRTRGKATLFQKTADKLPRDEWNLIVSWQVLEHLPDQAAATITLLHLRALALHHVHCICLAPPESAERVDPGHTLLLSRAEWLKTFSDCGYTHLPDREWGGSPELMVFRNSEASSSAGPQSLAR